MATKTIEKWKDGVLISSIEVEVDDEPEEQLTVPKSAVVKLAEDMANPNVNSIADLKTAITGFVEKIQ